MGGIIVLVVAIAIISAVVGLIANVLNKMNEALPPPRRPAPAPRPANPNVRGDASGNTDMDRFLAEIDRLRKRNAEGGGAVPAKPAPARAVPAARPAAATAARPAPGSRPRLVAERFEPATPDAYKQAEPPRRPAPPPTVVVDRPVAPGTLSPAAPRPEDLPVATVVTPTSSTGAPATRVTKIAGIAGRARPAAKTDLAKNLTSLLGSGQGVAMAVVLQEVLGPPKSRR